MVTRTWKSFPKKKVCPYCGFSKTQQNPTTKSWRCLNFNCLKEFGKGQRTLE